MADPPDLDLAIERLYVAFDVPRPVRIDGCPCCIDEKDVPTLLSTPRRSLTPKQLSPYAFSAFKTVGETADYLYFLPRILEVSAGDDSWWPDVEITGEAIRSAEADAWPAERREAVEAFFTAVIADVIRRGEYHRLGGWLCAIAQAGFDVRPQLTQIGACPEAVLAYFELNADALTRGRLSNGFWDRSDPGPGHAAILDWFRSEPIRRIPFDAYGYVMPP